jgi:hypothetical protein
LTDVCQQSTPSFILPVPTGGSTSWPGPDLLAGLSFSFLTAIASAFRWPINTTNFLSRAMPV